MTLEEAVRAAETGDLSAAKQAVWVLEPCAEICGQAGDWARAAAYWRQYRDCQEAILFAAGATEAERLDARRGMKRGLCGQGLACLHLGRVQMAVSLLAAAAEDGPHVPGDRDAKALLEWMGES